MTQMNQAMAALKLSLAEMRARDDRLKAMIRQFETQLETYSSTGHVWTGPS